MVGKIAVYWHLKVSTVVSIVGFRNRVSVAKYLSVKIGNNQISVCNDKFISMKNNTKITNKINR